MDGEVATDDYGTVEVDEADEEEGGPGVWGEGSEQCEEG